MPVTLVQFVGSGQNFATVAPGFYNFDININCTTGNSILLIAGGAFSAVAAWTQNPSVADSIGNTYTMADWVNGASTTSGGYCGMFFASNITGGSNVVTFTVELHQDLFFQPAYDNMIIVAEFSGLGTVTLRGHQVVQIYGAAGNSPVDVNFVDSQGTSVTVTFGGDNGSGGPGTIGAVGAVDLQDGFGGDFISGFCRNSPPDVIPETCSVTAPSGYTPMDLVTRQDTPDTSDHLWLWHGYHVGPVVASCNAPPSSTVGTPYSHTFGASAGTPPYTFAITAGALPAGITLNSSTGVASGTPTTPGTSSFTLQVTDSVAGTSTVDCSITINPDVLAISCGGPPAAVIGSPYSHAFPATGGVPPYTFSIASGSLPPGLTLDPATGIVSGIPTSNGTFPFTIQVVSS